ncbi:MAG TPA: CAP domain-containing protein [Terriglobales bacterium]
MSPHRFLPRKLPALGLLLWLSSALAVHAQQPQPASSQFDAAGETQLVDLINQARTAQGLNPLVIDERLTAAARKHTQLMVQHSTLSHQFEGEPSPETRTSNEGLPSDSEGENVDMNQSIEGAHDALMHSPPHRANILDPDYNVVGVGVIHADGSVWVTEDFARRLPQLSESQAESAVQTAIEHYERTRGPVAPVRQPLTQLRHMACDMALNDDLNLTRASHVSGVHQSFAWTAGDPAKLPKGIDSMLSTGLKSGYSLGACFAPSVSHPGGIYWLVMVAY